MCLDSSGNLYVADTGNSAVRMVPVGSPNKISIVAKIDFVEDVAISANGVIYATSDRHVIYKIESGIATQIAGRYATAGISDGFGSLYYVEIINPTYSTATFYYPTGIKLDSTEENLIIADWGGNSIRMFNLESNYVRTIAGSYRNKRRFVDSIGTFASLYQPSLLALDGDDNIYVADSLNNAIRKISK
jgi:sugar lactone lactonase YvrE